MDDAGELFLAQILELIRRIEAQRVARAGRVSTGRARLLRTTNHPYSGIRPCASMASHDVLANVSALAVRRAARSVVTRRVAP
jgi:hypothetical protein